MLNGKLLVRMMVDIVFLISFFISLISAVVPMIVYFIRGFGYEIAIVGWAFTISFTISTIICAVTGLILSEMRNA